MAKNERLSIPIASAAKVAEWVDALAEILDIASAHITDIETGVQDGLYDKADNEKTLPAKLAAVDLIEELQSALKQAGVTLEAGQHPSALKQPSASSARPVVCRLQNSQLATILAALCFYREVGRADPLNRDETNVGLTTGDGAFAALDDAGINELCEQLACPADKKSVLQSLKVHMDLNLKDCLNVFADDGDAPFVAYAREHLASDDVAFDDVTITSRGDDGAFVLGWLWVGNDGADLFRHSALLESVFDCAEPVLSLPGSSDIDQVYADWLEDLVSNYADELDEIKDEAPTGSPGPVVWQDPAGELHEFLPSTALTRLLELARQGGLSAAKAERTQLFCSTYGTVLDALLSVIQAPEIQSIS